LDCYILYQTCLDSTFAPQLEARLDKEQTRFLTPLVTSAHTVLQKPCTGTDCITDEETSVLPLAQKVLGCSVMDTTKSSISQRMKARKKICNSLAAKQYKPLTFDTSQEYTFEFYHHLLDFRDALAVDMGRPIGKVGLAQATDDQPLKFMSAHKDPTTGKLGSLWCFDIWHSSLFSHAEMAINGQ
jgi:hypothetical protein